VIIFTVITRGNPLGHHFLPNYVSVHLLIVKRKGSRLIPPPTAWKFDENFMHKLDGALVINHLGSESVNSPRV